jgi:hypothetical protein
MHCSDHAPERIDEFSNAREVSAECRDGRDVGFTNRPLEFEEHPRVDRERFGIRLDPSFNHLIEDPVTLLRHRCIYKPMGNVAEVIMGTEERDDERTRAIAAIAEHRRDVAEELRGCSGLRGPGASRLPEVVCERSETNDDDRRLRDCSGELESAHAVSGEELKDIVGMFERVPIAMRAALWRAFEF